MPSTGIGSCPLRGQVDPRLVRFSAGATASVLAVAVVVLEVARPLGLGLLASQVAVFGFTAFVSFQWSVWAQVFAGVIWPRLQGAAEPQDARPPRFAQLIGFVVTSAALVAFVLGEDGVGYGLTAVVICLTALDAATGLCPGCAAYRWVRARTT